MDIGSPLPSPSTPTLPARLFIANRGEIAVRIASTCRVLGVRSVAAFTAADREGLHVAAADESVEIDSYVDAQALAATARARGCDAVHPGYGFLSENPAFALAVVEAGLTFVGPPVEAMRVMGSKTRARAAMRAAGVPVVPGSDPVELAGSAGAPGTARPTGAKSAKLKNPGYSGDEGLAHLQSTARELGYPVLIKAVSGGGGKGMSRVDQASDLARLAAQAADEAKRWFGDGRVYVERLIERPRHIEIQIFGDSHGNCVALGERECSIQRRHQKIVEETPSPIVDDDLRSQMSAAAVAAGIAVGYQGAGTVEFLLETALADDPAQAATPHFYFLEMNTRLQVEHPVTEWVTGLDLVRLQLEVASGSELSLAARNPTFRGHSVECRIYAEDPAIGFLPQTGTILVLREPAGPGVRVDSALVQGQAIGIDFDPLLAKISTWGHDREEARLRMLDALRNTVILGVRTNVDHLQDLVSHPAFVAGHLSTEFLFEHMAHWPPPQPEAPLAALLAAAALAGRTHRASSRTVATEGPGSKDGNHDSDPWRARALEGFRIGGTSGADP